MSLDGVLRTGLWTQEAVEAYNKRQSTTCDKLGNSVDSYDGIYACGLVRFNKLALATVPLWRAMMEASETNGDVYSASMIDTIVLERGVPPSPSPPGTGIGQ